MGDFNADGKLDLALSHGGVDLSPPPKVWVLLNTCPYAGVRLAAQRNNTNLTLSWPLPYTNFTLEATTNSGSPSWEPVVEPLATNRGKCEVTVPLSQEQRYFRLRKP